VVCFQTALEDHVLRLSAIQAWGTLIEKIDIGDKDVGTMVGHMFAAFVQICQRCSKREKDVISVVVGDAVTRHEKMLKADYTLPSLSSIPELQSIASALDEWREKAPQRLLQELIRRCSHEIAVICHRGLIELREYLEKNEIFVHSLILGEDREKSVTSLIRCLLDVTCKYHDSDPEVVMVSIECLGIVGAIDPSKADVTRDSVDFILQHNFHDAEESVTFAMTLIENKLVGCFRSATDTKAQAYLAWAMQELLIFCSLNSQILDTSKGFAADMLMVRKWGRFSKAARETLTPLLTSKYSITANPPRFETTNPIFPKQKTYRDWLQTFTLAIMNEGQGENARKLFTTICSRIIRDQDLGIANFVLPYAVVNVIISGTDNHRENIRLEFLAVLESGGTTKSDQEAAKSRLANQTVFSLVDYLHKWLRQHRKSLMERKLQLAKKANRYVAADEYEEGDAAMAHVEGVLSALPPDLMATASFQCGSYDRALFHWEQFIRDSEKNPPSDGMDPLYARWQEIYKNLEEPDGIEGISAKFTFQTFEQQIIEHENAGNWSAAQSCFELSLQQDPSNLAHQKGFLNCIKQSGHHETYLSQISGLMSTFPQNAEIYSTLAIESSWMAGNWGLLAKHLENSDKSGFEYELGTALQALYNGNDQTFQESLSILQTNLGHAIVAAGTDSSRQCYDALARLHAVQEVKAIRSRMTSDASDRRNFMAILDERLTFMVPMSRYQQFTLALRRAAITLSTYSPSSALLILVSQQLTMRSDHCGFPVPKLQEKQDISTKPMVLFSERTNSIYKWRASNMLAGGGTRDNRVRQSKACKTLSP
jgi:serine/threonine-protein kinase ATR